MSTERNEKRCETNRFTRPYYFDGMLLEKKDFQAEQAYQNGKRRLLNQTLYGQGVVCGLEIDWQPGEKCFKILPGLAFDPFGNEIYVDEALKVELHTLLTQIPKSRKDPCKNMVDDITKDYCIGICYNEVCSDPVPIYLPGGSCGEQTCKPSRKKEGFCIQLLEANSCCASLNEMRVSKKTHCKKNQENTAAEVDQKQCWGIKDNQQFNWKEYQAFCRRSLPCPEYPDKCESGSHHCISLGKLILNNDETIESICIHECRTYVFSGRMMQYLIYSLFDNLASCSHLIKNNDIEDLNPLQLTKNPIYALCWLTKHLLVDSYELSLKEELKKDPMCSQTFAILKKILNVDDAAQKEEDNDV